LGALWTFVEEPNVGHAVGRSQEMATIFFDAILPLRLNMPGTAVSVPLAALDERSGFLGDIAQKRLRPASDRSTSTGLTAWLPTQRVGRAWQALLRRETFED
jgi:hypothetical protein